MSDNNPSPNAEPVGASSPVGPVSKPMDERSTRLSVGYGVFVLAAIFVLLSVFCFLKFSGVLAPPSKDAPQNETTEPSKKKAKDKSSLDQKDDTASTPKYVKGSPDYFVGGLASALFAIGLIGFGIRQFSVEPSASSTIPLKVEGGLMGALFGVTLSLLALGFAWNQQKVFFELTGPNFSENVVPALMLVLLFFAGLVIAFVSLILIRSQERTNSIIRRLIYGFSSTMLVVIVCLVLFVANGVVAVHVPSALVTNESAFQGISPPAKTFLKTLQTPVKAYMIMPEANPRLYDGLYSDCRALLSDCKSANSLFEYEVLTPGLHDSRITDILTQYQVQKEDLGDSGKGILLVVNDDPKRKAFFPARSLYRQEQASQNNPESVTTFFEGENKILSTLISQLDDKSGQKIYFTQGHGEIPFEQIQADPRGNHPDTLAPVVSHLRELGYTVLPLDLSKEKAKVPDDAVVVVIAEPSQTVPVNSPMQTALREYADKGGRILAFMAVSYSAGKVQATGLEEFFLDYGIRIDANKRYVGGPTRIIIPNQGYMLTYEELGLVVPDKLSSPLVGVFRNTQQQLFAKDTRPISITQSQKSYVNQIVLSTPVRQPTWKEEDERVNFERVVQQLRQDKTDELAQRKEFSIDEKPVVVVSSRGDREGEKTKPRLIFVSCSQILPISGDPRLVPFAKLSVIPDLIDHLRERDSQLGVQAKKLPTYKPTGTYDFGNQVLFMLIVMGVVVGLGITVWFARRR